MNFLCFTYYCKREVNNEAKDDEELKEQAAHTL
jgi:hypothetical protein